MADSLGALSLGAEAAVAIRGLMIRIYCPGVGREADSK